MCVANMISLSVSFYFHFGSCGSMGCSVTYVMDSSIKIPSEK